MTEAEKVLLRTTAEMVERLISQVRRLAAELPDFAVFATDYESQAMTLVEEARKVGYMVRPR